MTTPFGEEEPLSWLEQRDEITEREKRVLDRLAMRADITTVGDREALEGWWRRLSAEQQAAAERASRQPEMAREFLDAAWRAREGGPAEVPDPQPTASADRAGNLWPEVEEVKVTHDDGPFLSTDPRAEPDAETRIQTAAERCRKVRNAAEQRDDPAAGRTEDDELARRRAAEQRQARAEQRGPTIRP